MVYSHVNIDSKSDIRCVGIESQPSSKKHLQTDRVSRKYVLLMFIIIFFLFVCSFVNNYSTYV